MFANLIKAAEGAEWVLREIVEGSRAGSPDDEGITSTIDELETAIEAARAASRELLEACEIAINYFEDTRHGREWIESGGVEAKVLRKAIRNATIATARVS